MTNSSSTVHIYMTYNLRWEPEVLQDFTSLSHFQLLLIISLSISSKEWNTPFTEEKWHLSLSVLISLYYVPVVSCGITNASLAQCYMILNCNILLLYFKVWFHLNGAFLCLFFVYLFDFSVGDNICISITPPNCGDSDNSNLSSWKTKDKQQRHWPDYLWTFQFHKKKGSENQPCMTRVNSSPVREEAMRKNEFN